MPKKEFTLKVSAKNAWPPAGTVASGDHGVEVVMEREQRFLGGHRISLNGLDLEPVPQLQDEVINRGMSVAVSPPQLSVECEFLLPSGHKK